MAAVDYFLKIDGIEGESGDSVHKGQIELESWSWGESNTGGSSHGGGGGAGKVAMQDFHFVMKMNKATPKLILACAQGTHIPACVLTGRKAGGGQQEYFNYKFSDVFISSYQTGGSGGGEIVPMDQISFNFTKIEMEYKEQKKDGSTTTSAKMNYDVKANKGGA